MDGHEERIQTLEKNMSTMLTQIAVTNEKLNTISKQLENGIKLRLDTLTRDMSKILPIIEKDLGKETAIDIAVAVAIKTAVIGGILTVFGSVGMFLLKLFFNLHG